jgi:hypothetical protein
MKLFIKKWVGHLIYLVKDHGGQARRRDRDFGDGSKQNPWNPGIEDQDAADRAVLVAMGCSRDPDDCDMAWYRQQYARKLAG